MRNPIGSSLVLLALAAGICRGADPPVSLQIDTEKWVLYTNDSADYPKLASVAAITSTLLPLKTFSTWVSMADVTAINGRPMRGLQVARGTSLWTALRPPIGQSVADVSRFAMLDVVFELLSPDGTPVGSITATGMNSGAPAPGLPVVADRDNLTVTGGSGAFLGIRGQLGGHAIASHRLASATEDPALRRGIPGAGSFQYIFQLMPASQPEIVATPTGPAIARASDFSLVTSAKPARPGEILALFATGLGLTRPAVDPGQPFTKDKLHLVQWPVVVTLDGRQAEVIGAAGYPGAVDRYQVNFRVPENAASGTRDLVLSSAFIPGAAVKISIQ
jgi:hypothetical protein